ncbi:MAG: ATPase domain-containing protein [Candidatus Thermoplasmatota archaeon]
MISLEDISINYHTLKKQDKKYFKKILKPDIVLQSGISRLDKLLDGGFKAGEITLVNGDNDITSDIPSHLAVNTYRLFDKKTVFIDTGMKANPYLISRYAKRMEMKQKEVLEKIYICRAFTVHQLSTIIHEKLESLIKRQKPHTFIVGDIAGLYIDSDVKKREGRFLIKNNLSKIKDLTLKYNLTTVFTNRYRKKILDGNYMLNDIYKKVDETVEIEKRKNSVFIHLLNKNCKDLIFISPDRQLTLNDFGMVIN